MTTAAAGSLQILQAASKEGRFGQGRPFLLA